MSDQFALGWAVDKEAEAKEAWAPKFVAFSSVVQDTRPLPEAYSGSQDALSWMDQGPVGTCAPNAGIWAIEAGICGANRLGRIRSEMRRLSRAYNWYRGRQLDGSLRSRGDGVTITNTMRALDEYGAPPEEMWTYKPERSWIDRTPPEDVVQKALLYQFEGVAALDFRDKDTIKRSIFTANYPVIGIPWARSWDHGADQYGRVKSLGWVIPGEAHALVLAGWINDWDGQLWWQIPNTHGPIYGIPPADIRARIEGYTPAQPNRCYSFWVPDNILSQRLGGWGSEIIAALNVVAVPRTGGGTWYDV